MNKSLFMSVSTSVTGEPGTTEYRLYFKNGAATVSPWHDIPLKDGNLFNFVNEIPKYTKV